MDAAYTVNGTTYTIDDPKGRPIIDVFDEVRDAVRTEYPHLPCEEWDERTEAIIRLRRW